MSMRVSPPWSVPIELTAGCNLRCPFCGIHSMGWKHDEFRFMAPEDAAKIARNLRSLADHPRIEFALRGEPTMNPGVLDCVNAFRRGVPKAQLMMTTNALRLLQPGGDEIFSGLFDYGLNILAVDCYEPRGAEVEAYLRGLNLAGVSYHGSHEFIPWHNYGNTGRHVVFIPDLRRDNDKHRVIFNQGGNSRMGAKLTEPLKKTCPNVWHELSIHFDGDVPICCDDWGKEYIIGNALREPLTAIWYGERMNAARRYLRHKGRWFRPCNRCDGASGGRNNAIALCDPPTEEDHAVILDTLEISPNFLGRGG